jgi:protein phosphatase
METQTPQPAVEFAQKSDPGRDPEKQINEDACGYRETRFGHLAIVCDGMGGHAGGQEAANLALATVLDVFDKAPRDARPGPLLKEALEEANRRVYGMIPLEPGSRPGSTVVAILMHHEGTEVAHVGDSRCYQIHQSQIFQITKDHSMVQELVDHGLLTPAQAAVHPNANQITRALGMGPEVEVDLRPQPVIHVVGDAFVLCSDGLSDLVQPGEILQIVTSAPAAQAAGQLVDLANARGGHDNISVQILRARESANAQPGQVAPTLAQTSHEEARATQPQIPLPMGSGPHIPPAPEPPPSSRAARRRGGPSVTVVMGVLLAIAGLAIAASVLYGVMKERTGHHHRPPAIEPEASDFLIPEDAAVD